MFKIGDFSRLSQVTVKTLRYYDELGLLTPARVDRVTGYRYYSAEQMARLNRILALKDLGLALEQIADLLNDNMPAEQIRGMLRMKQAEMRQHVTEEMARLARVEARLTYMDKEQAMPTYDVIVKHVEPLTVAAVREVIPSYAAIGALFSELCPFIFGQRVAVTGPAIAIYHDREYRERDVDVELALPVSGPVPEHPRIAVRELPAAQMACLVHLGPYERLHEAYAALMSWIEANGYQITGPNREIYLRGIDEVQGDAEACITEVQVPVERG